MLWMVLHYELFLEDVKPRFEEDGLDMRKFNAKLKKRAKDKIDYTLMILNLPPETFKVNQRSVFRVPQNFQMAKMYFLKKNFHIKSIQL